MEIGCFPKYSLAHIFMLAKHIKVSVVGAKTLSLPTNVFFKYFHIKLCKGHINVVNGLFNKSQKTLMPNYWQRKY